MVTTRLLIGEVVTGRITTTLAGAELPTALSWSDELNRTGTTQVTIPADVVAKYGLRQLTHGGRCFLAVEVDNRIKVAGPIWSRTWDWKAQQLTLAAAGIWSLADKRIIYDDAAPGGVLTFTGSLGGIAVGMVAAMLNRIPPYTNLPIVLPAVEAGDRTESFPRWELSRYGEQLRQITQRAVDAPDIAFRGRRRGDDSRFLEWVMQVGTEFQPSLTQGGPDWVLDASAPSSPVRGVSTDEDATQMAELVSVTGNGSEDGMLIATGQSVELVDLGWPLTEADEAHSTVDDYATLLGHADNLLARSSRPIEVFKVEVSADAANEVQPGDYARLVVKADPWLGDMDRTMRVKTVSGDLSETVVLEMFPLQAQL